MVRKILLLAVLLFSNSLFAGESLYFGIRHQFNGTRAMGMGGAFTAVADDNTAIFYNPAGLVQLKAGESNWFLKFDGDPEIGDLYKDIDDAKSNPPPGVSDEEAMTDILQKNYGNHYSFRMPSLGWLWARPNWGLAVIPADFSMDLGLHRTVGPSINLIAINDTTVAFTYNWDIKAVNYGKLSLGVTSKAIYRMEVNKVVSVAQISNDGIFREQDAREGFTVDADVGLLWQSPWEEEWKLKGAMVIRNILDYGYLAQFSLIGDESGKPDNLHRTIDLGAALELPGVWNFSHRIAFDYRDMLHPNFSLRKGFHFGYEFDGFLASWLRGAFRVGINQGYLTAGWTGEFTVFRLDLATFAEEIGSGDTTLENRRYMLTMSLDF